MKTEQHPGTRAHASACRSMLRHAKARTHPDSYREHKINLQKYISFSLKFLFFIFSFSLQTMAQTWNIVGTDGMGCDAEVTGCVCPATHDVYSLHVINNELYVGGNFTSQCSYGMCIAKFNGLNWDSLSWGLNGVPYSLATYYGNIFVGGQIYNALSGWDPPWWQDSVVPNTHNLAKWDGIKWNEATPFAAPNGIAINKVINFRNEIYIGGTESFKWIDSKPCKRIAKWNGTEWDNMQGGVDGGWWPEIWDMEIFNDELYIGGSFDWVGNNIPAKNIAKYDGTKWDTIPAGGLIMGDIK